MTDQSFLSGILRAKSVLSTDAKFQLWFKYRNPSYPLPTAGMQLDRRGDTRISSD